MTNLSLIETTLYRQSLKLLAKSLLGCLFAHPVSALEISPFELPVGESMFVLDDREQNQKARFDKDDQSSGQFKVIAFRQLDHLSEDKRIAGEDEWALVYWLHKRSKEVGPRDFTDYEDDSGAELRARFYFRDGELVVLPLVEDESLTEDHIEIVKAFAHRELIIFKLAKLAASKNWEPGEVHNLDSDLLASFGSQAGSIALDSVENRWEHLTAGFKLQLSYENGRACDIRYLTLVDPGRPVHINWTCSLDGRQTYEGDLLDVYYRDYMSQSFSYSDISIGVISPEPVLAMQPKGLVEDVVFSDLMDQLAFLTKDSESDSTWLSFWDLNQRKVLFTRQQVSDSLQITRSGDKIFGIGKNRMQQGWVKIGSSYEAFGSAVSFHQSAEKQIVDSGIYALYPVTLNAGSGLEIWNVGYNKVSDELPITVHHARSMALAPDGRLVTLGEAGDVAVHQLNIESLCDGDIDVAFCDVVDFSLEEAESLVEGLSVGAGYGELHIHPSEPWIAFCGFGGICSLANYEIGKSTYFIARNAHFDSAGRLHSDRGEVDLDTGMVLSNRQSGQNLTSMALSESHGLLFNSASTDSLFEGEILVRNLSDGSIIDTITRQVRPVSRLVVMNDGNLGSVTTVGQDDWLSTIEITGLEVQRRKLPRSIRNISSRNGWLVFSRDSQMVIVNPSKPDEPETIERSVSSLALTDDYLIYASGNSVYRYDLESGKTEQLHKFSSPVHEIALLDDDGQKIVASLNHGVFALPHIGAELSLPFRGGFGSAIEVSADRTSFYVSNLVGYSKAFNPAIEVIQKFDSDGKPIQEMQPVWGTTSAMLADSTGQLWFGDSSGDLILRDGHSGLILERISAHQGAIVDIEQLNSDTIATGSSDGSIKLWYIDMLQGKFQSRTLGTLYPTFIANDIGRRQMRLKATITVDINGEFIVSLSDGYYWATPRALHNAAFKNGDKIFDYARFDYWLNRPDLVLERLGQPDQTALRQWRKVVSYRQARNPGRPDKIHAGQTEASLALSGPDPVVVDDSVLLTLDIKGEEAEFLHVMVNQVPVFGSAGKKVTAGKSTLSVELTPGKNRIRAFVTDRRGLQSETQYLTYHQPPGDNRGDLFVLAIGVSDYQQDYLDLEFASKDAVDVISALQGSEQYSQVKSLAILDSDAKRENILAAKSFLTEATAADSVVVFFAGHGLLDAEDNYYFGTTDIDPEDPEANGLAYQEMSSLVDGIAARQKLMMMDTCYSGEVVESPSEVALPPGVSTRGLTYSSKSELDISLGMLQKTFVDLRATTGATVISAAGGREFAIETSGVQNGIFTASFVKALLEGDRDEDGTVTVSEIRDFTYDEVTRLSNGAQRPTARKHNLDIDFAIY